MSLKMNPILASSLYELSDSQSIRVVLLPEVIETIRAFFWGICRICTQGETTAYVLKSYNKYSFYTWAEQSVTQKDVTQSGRHIYEIRKRIFTKAELPRAISMAEFRREEAGWHHGNTNPHVRIYHVECILHTPKYEDPEREMFDIGRLIDLPPEGYPLSSAPIETLRNVLMKRDPGSRNREWSWHQRLLLLHEAAEERHANRVLDNERLVESTRL